MSGVRWLLVGLFACNGGDVSDASAKQPKGGAPAPATTSAPTSTAAPACTTGMPEIVAEIGGVPVTRDELMAAAGSDIIAAEVALADARKGALENYILQKLAEAEAKKQGVSAEEWFQKELAAASKPATEEEIAAFYRENLNQMQGASLDQVRPQIAQFLQQRNDAAAVGALADRLEREGGVKTFLEPFRLTVDPKDSPRTGSPTAPVQIVEFSDFQCPYCSMAADTVRKVEEKYGDKVSIVYRHYPLPNHGAAHRAAEASQCANDQGQFWKFHDKLFGDQKSWTDDDYRKYAADLGLDAKAFAKCLEGGQHAATVQEDLADGRAVGMGGTPGFYVNGMVLSGAQPLEAFVEIIDAELARLGG